MDIVFAEDIRKGLTAEHKYIPDRQYYDDRGSVYFQELMATPDYYVTSSELEIFKTYKSELCRYFSDQTQAVNIIEFGAGDALKTKILLSECHRHITTRYFAIDFSKKYLSDMEVDFAKHMPQIDLHTINADYFDALKTIPRHKSTKNIIFFIGSSLGGLLDTEFSDFFRRITKLMTKGDLLFLGLDLKKMPETLYKAYHHTCKNWCFYLLQRINNELGGNFNLKNFEYYTTYNPEDGKFKWFFISKKPQRIHIQALNLTVDVEEGEPIYIGQSKKFSIREINATANTYDFEIVNYFFDKNRYFANVIMEKR